jgi:hypothetical protein
MLGVTSPRCHTELFALLDSMIHEVGEDESPPLTSLMENVGVLIEKL